MSGYVSVKKLCSGVLLALALALDMRPVDAQQRGELNAEHLRNMAIVIRSQGYACEEASYGAYQGKTPYGLEFKVRCDSGTFQVIVTPSDSFLVNTWANRQR